MSRVNCLYGACGDLFADYPLAVTTDNPSGSARSMILMQQGGGGGVGFFVLTDDHNEGQHVYSLHPWRAPGGVDIDPDADAVIPDVFAQVIDHGVPVPRHGSLCGWEDRDTVTALVPFYSQYTPESPEPSWATMPIAGSPEDEWPPFADEPFFGHWFWEHYRAGRVISLGDLVAATPGVVFWVDTTAIIGSGCCVVAHDVRSPDGLTLQHGRYVYYQALRAGKEVPSLKALLADGSRTDLAPRFRPPRPSEDRL